MHKTKFAILALTVLVLAGCGENKKESVGSKSTEQKTVSGDYISGTLKNTQEPTPAKNTTPTETANQNNKTTNMDLVNKYQFAEINTTLGKIKVKFYGADSPKTVENFLKLASEKFYDGTKFHRVIKDFMIQGGDPNSKSGDGSNWGMGGPGYTVPAEIKLKNKRGTLATARLSDQMNPKKDSSGSQFFINTVDNAFLDGGYTVFGEVLDGMDVVDKIESVKTTGSPSDRPLEEIVIKSITPLEK